MEIIYTLSTHHSVYYTFYFCLFKKSDKKTTDNLLLGEIESAF